MPPVRSSRNPANQGSQSDPLAADALKDGREAIARGDWAQAREHLCASIANAETPEAHEHLGLAAWWLDDATLTFSSRERAYSLYRERGDSLGAARVAVWLVWDCLAFRGDFAVASGWLERARRLLADHPHAAEYGWFLIREGEVLLFRGHDPRGAIELAEKAAALGRTAGDHGVEFTALALQGLALVSSGDVAGGMRCLDEATVAATAGEMKELHAVGLVCCWQIFACERVRDYDRAAQWCARVQEFTRRWGLQPLSALCRAQYAGVLIWRGDWTAAEAELTRSARELEATRPGMTSGAVTKLGELRLRQGNEEEAERLFELAPTHPVSRMGVATLALHRGRASESAAMLAQFLEQLGPDDITARAGALELLVRAHSAAGDVDAGRGALGDLLEIARRLGTTPLRASAASARGVLAASAGDTGTAVRELEVAVTLYEESGAPFETARARLDLADALCRAGQRVPAAREVERAAKALAALEARHELQRAEGLRAALRSAKSKSRARDLTGRQVEILRLIASGLSSAGIAKRLRISEHTVKRHVANLFTRLGLSSRAAAVAYAARAGLLDGRTPPRDDTRMARTGQATQETP